MRRSQATEVTLPLDLHVLGLPLAFILSQDQTLHCSVLQCQLSSTPYLIQILLKSLLRLLTSIRVNELLLAPFQPENPRFQTPFKKSECKDTGSVCFCQLFEEKYAKSFPKDC